MNDISWWIECVFWLACKNEVNNPTWKFEEHFAFNIKKYVAANLRRKIVK